VASLTVHDLQRWFAARKETPSSEVGSRGKLSSLFQFAVRQNWIASDPCKRLEPIRVDSPPPRILTVEQARIALEWTAQHAPRMMLYLVLGMFAGLRPIELTKLQLDAIGSGRIVVGAGVAKTRSRRIIPVDEHLAAWISLGGDLPAVPWHVAIYYHKLRRVLKLKPWPKDVLRHTFISYAYAQNPDLARLASIAGNSPGVILRHYRALVTKEDADRFWSLLPRQHAPNGRGVGLPGAGE
jgi:integrase